MDGRPTTTSQHGRSGLLAALLTLALLSGVPETLASGELRAEAQGKVQAKKSRGVAETASTVPGDDGANVRHLVADGETLASILGEHGLPATEINAWEQAAASAYGLDNIRPTHAIELTFAKDQGRLLALEYEIDPHSLLSLRLIHGQIQARLKAMPQLAAVRGIAGRVDASLATSASAAGVPVQMISELADLFGWDVDLQQDVHPGDEFRLLYAELADDDGGAPRPGDILAAEITSGGRTLTAIRFENDKGETEYYDLDGRALGRQFLKYPVEYRKITSNYTGARFHPVLRRFRPHRGVDFSAPAGTPVRAVASGIVTFAGRSGQYGNHIEIEHQEPYSTSYSHLQAFVRGLHVGETVRKGQVIGYVGSSGMATGPHLHFMLFENGVYVDPLHVKLPTDEQISGARWKRFATLRSDLVARLASLGSSIELHSMSLSPVSLLDLLRPHGLSSIN
jgi:murein DD-endopeptidase MepM/ murein hydrolase activator NlpD